MDHFELRIRITGLCLFVPGKNDGLMHVLMPKNNASHHVPVVEFNAAHVGKAGRKPVSHPLDGRILDLGGLPGKPSKKLPNEVVKLSKVSGGKIDLADDRRVAARVRIGGGKPTHRRGLARWKLDGDPVHMANWLRWTVKKVEGTELKLTLKRIGDEGAEEVPYVLKPVQEVITLTIRHVPHEELQENPCTDPEPPQKPYVPEHFAAYYGMLVDTKKAELPLLDKAEWPFPDAVDAADPEQKEDCSRMQEEGFRGIAYSCMIASADPM